MKLANFLTLVAMVCFAAFVSLYALIQLTTTLHHWVLTLDWVLLIVGGIYWLVARVIIFVMSFQPAVAQ